MSQTGKVTTLKFCIRHAIMAVIAHAKFHFNQASEFDCELEPSNKTLVPCV